MIEIQYIGHPATIPNWPQAGTVAGLIDALERWPLEPSMNNAGRPCFQPHPARRPYRGPALLSAGSRFDEKQGNTVYLDGDPIYPGAPDAVTFAGNFIGYSFGFHLSTDEPEVIERLDAAIAENLSKWPQEAKHG